MTTRTRKTAATAVSSANQNGFSLITNDKLLQLYSTMLKCRLLEERMRTLRKVSGQSGAHPAAISLEAATVGVVMDLGCEDAISMPPQDFIAGFVKGVPLETIFDRVRAQPSYRDKSPSSPSQIGYPLLNVLPAPSRTSARLNIVNGISLWNKTRKNNSIAVAFCGDERSTPQSSWHKALRFAGANGLPIVFVHQRNAAVGKKREIEHISLKTQAHNLPCIVVDGNDAVAVYRVASEAIAHARKGNGPTLIECSTAYTKGDPLHIMEKYLSRKGLYSERAKAKVVATFSREMDRGIRRSRGLALPQRH